MVVQINAITFSDCSSQVQPRDEAFSGSSCTGQTATPEEIREFCKGQIAHYKIPRYIEFVDEFPMTITGKIQKFVMREQTIKKLGLKAEKTA